MTTISVSPRATYLHIWIVISIVVVSAVLQSPAIAQKPIKIPMTADRWETKDNVEFSQADAYPLGVMKVNKGVAVLKEFGLPQWNDRVRCDSDGVNGSRDRLSPEGRRHLRGLLSAAPPELRRGCRLHAVCSADAWSAALGRLSSIPGTGPAEAGDMEPYQAGGFRTANEYLCEWRVGAHARHWTAGRGCIWKVDC